MTISLIVAMICVALALGFDFVNGFHDTANAVATVIYSKTLKPRTAILMSAVFNFLGALTVGTSVALFITGVVPLSLCTPTLLLSVLTAGLIWNLITWYVGLPISSSHCLIGSLVGAGIAAAGISGLNLAAFYKAIAALLVSPALGFIIALILAFVINYLVKRLTARQVDSTRALQWMQIASSASLSFSHGGNDGQKIMGIITLILATQLPDYGYTVSFVPFWVICAAALAIAAGTATGGWRIIKTVGERLSRKEITTTHGCAAEMTTALVVFGASHVGVPVSTTHVLTSAVLGGTCGLHGKSELHHDTLRNVLMAWILTLPVTAVLAGAIYLLASSF